MSTATRSDTAGETKPGPPIHSPHQDQEIRLYSHSDVFYWWPVWAVGFLLAC